MGGGRQVRVFFCPVPCPKANIDREKTAWRVASDGFEIAEEAESADVVVVFTCGFIDDAKQEAIDDILAYAAMKREGKIKSLVVAGCLAEKYGPELARQMPEVDCFVGTGEIDRLSQVIREVSAGGNAGRIRRSGDRDRSRFSEQVERIRAGRPWTRAVMICDGCDNACTYCAIPEMRGRLRSRPEEEILREAKALVEQGAGEIVLAGQDTASYGRDLVGSTLGSLIARLARESGAHWIRLAYANPENITVDVAQAIRDHANVCHYIDMPVQHASPKILAAMGRKKPPEEMRRLVDRVRETVPDIALRTSVIVGFPGETEKDFRALLDFLERVRFDMVGAFRFSAQPGTPASRLPDKVPARVAEDRLVEVTCLAHEIARTKTEDLVGKTLEVLVESRKGGSARGRSAYDMAEVDRVIAIRNCAARPGEFIKVRITGYVGPYDVQGTSLEG